MNPRPRLPRLCRAALFGAALLAGCGRHEDPAPASASRNVDRAVDTPAPATPQVGAPAPTADEASAGLRIAATQGALAAPHTPMAARALLASLKQALGALPTEAAAAAVVAFLASGQDAPTGLPFAAAADGTLASAPSLRVALMDLLPALDPDAALVNARAVMDARSNVDEYALGLRNLAWNDVDGDLRGELVTRFSAMLAEPGWRAQPAPSFLAAFDVAVEAGDRAAIDAVASVVSTHADGAASALNHAAFIALDRMVTRQPALLVELYADQPRFLEDNPPLRASLLSRLDITDPDQRATFSAYLANPTIAAGEQDYFAELFPNGNYVYSDRLVSASEPTPSIASRAAMDQAIALELDKLAGTTPAGAPATTLAHIRSRLAALTAPVAATPAPAPTPP